MTKHEPLHLSAATAHHLPQADATLAMENNRHERDDGMRLRRTEASELRRNPYVVYSVSNKGHSGKSGNAYLRSAHQSISDFGQSSKPLHKNPLSTSFSLKVPSPAYNSYKHGTRSIARSRQTNGSPNSAKSPLRKAPPFLAASPQLDAPPDAALMHYVSSNVLRRGQKLVDDLNGSSESRIRYQLFLIVPVLIIIILSAPSMIDPIVRDSEWQWSPDRRLNDRQCVMNLFIERQPPDEFNPDFVKPPKEFAENGKKFKQPPPEIVEGTYRTVGQLKVINRLIESVANSFRSNTKLKQHLIFTGARDGGQLASDTIARWPPRGSHRTQLHIIAADHISLPPSYNRKVVDTVAEDPLQYGYLEAIEERFAGKDEVHIYDRYGEASTSEEEEDDDEDGSMDGIPWSHQSRRNLQVVEETETQEDAPEEEEEEEATEEILVQTPEAPLPDQLNSELLDSADAIEPYPEIASFLPSEEDNHIIPYMHVDGVSMKSQMEILESARSLMEDNTIVTIGIEHSPDMDVYALIDFFNAVEYKTFFLGSRKIARIDHLCPEILEDVIRHPSISKPKLTRTGKWLKRLGLLKSELDEDDQMHKYPPFFVAMPRGRINKEEMTIQHMYDLFGGYDGGSGQVQTANDRKAPGKK